MTEFEDRGTPFLLLHGGGGPQTVAAFATLLAEHGRVITPTHPGFAGAARPATLTDMQGLAALYLTLLDDLDLHDVTVVGNSIGGWIAAEMGAQGSRRISKIILVNAVGLHLEAEPVADIFPLTPAELAELSFHNPDKFTLDPTTMSEEQRSAMAENRATLAVYGGTTMTDKTLQNRLRNITAPTLVLWGEADQIATPAYGRAFAKAIPNANFHLLKETGHVPQVETPQQLLTEVLTFAKA
jgi:pimeloyl-ACP methyl ester carboxylesterase